MVRRQRIGAMFKGEGLCKGSDDILLFLIVLALSWSG